MGLIAWHSIRVWLKLGYLCDVTYTQVKNNSILVKVQTGQVKCDKQDKIKAVQTIWYVYILITTQSRKCL